MCVCVCTVQWANIHVTEVIWTAVLTTGLTINGRLDLCSRWGTSHHIHSIIIRLFDRNFPLQRMQQSILLLITINFYYRKFPNVFSNRKSKSHNPTNLIIQRSHITRTHRETQYRHIAPSARRKKNSVTIGFCYCLIVCCQEVNNENIFLLYSPSPKYPEMTDSMKNKTIEKESNMHSHAS